MNPFAPIIILLFPLWLPVWQDRPLTSADLNPGLAGRTASLDVVEKARDGFVFCDAGTRARLAVCLRLSDRPEALQVLAEQLLREKDPAVLATILQQLDQTPAPLTADTARPFLSHASPEVAAAAVRLLGRVAPAEVEATARFAANPATPAAIRTAAWEVLAGNPALVSDEFAARFATDPDPAVRANALRCRIRPDLTPAAGRDLVAAAAPANPPAVRAALAERLDRLPATPAVEAAGSLLSDPVPGIRTAAIAALGRRAGDAGAVSRVLPLTGDADPAVRLAALQTLAALKPAGLEPVQRAVTCLGDASRLVRNQAEETLVVLHALADVTPAVATRLEDTDPAARRQAAQTLGWLMPAAAAQSDLVAKALTAETLAANRAVQLLALGRTGDAARHGAAVLSHAADSDPAVRAAVAEAVGRLRVPATEELLKTLALETDATVRAAALEAMGRNPSPQYAETLLKALKETSRTIPLERAAAAWSAGRIRPVPKALMDRLVTQITKPVISTPMGPVFDDDTVMANAAFSLAFTGREVGKPWADMARTLATTLTAPPASITSPGAIAPTPEIAEAGRQMRACLDGVSPELAPRPRQDVTFPYTPSTRAGTP